MGGAAGLPCSLSAAFARLCVSVLSLALASSDDGSRCMRAKKPRSFLLLPTSSYRSFLSLRGAFRVPGYGINSRGIVFPRGRQAYHTRLGASVDRDGPRRACDAGKALAAPFGRTASLVPRLERKRKKKSR